MTLIFPLFLALPAGAVEPELRAQPDSSDMVSKVYRDVIVVQRKAKLKAGKKLLNAFVTTDFADGPQAIYSINLSFGYALSDELEAYASIAPLFLTQDRPIKNAVSDLVLADGKQAVLDSPKPRLQFAGELLWIPLYGKDSWGAHHIIRSDTFFKVTLGMVQFEGDSGFRLGGGIGKTYYLGESWNLRLVAGIGFRQTVVNEKKAMSQMGFFEAGNVWYF